MLLRCHYNGYRCEGRQSELGPWRGVTVYCPDRTASAALIAATLLPLRPRVWHPNYAKTRQLLKPDATCEVRLHLNSPLLYCSGGSSSMKTAEIGMDGGTRFNDSTSCGYFPRGHRQHSLTPDRYHDLCGVYCIWLMTSAVYFLFILLILAGSLISVNHNVTAGLKSYKRAVIQREGDNTTNSFAFLIASTMRFSPLVLLVALPVVACATLSPQQLSVRQIENCVQLGHDCFYPLTVCCGEDNHCPMTHGPGTVLSVCSSVSSLPLTNWYVRCAPPNPVLESGSLG